MNANHKRSMSLAELAEAYGVSHKVMRAWLAPHERTIGKRVGHYYTPKQVQLIFDCLGKP